MTNLTDKWKKSELPSGWYYVRLIRGEHRIDLYINGKKEWIDCPDNIIDTVVCKVPSFEEWEDLKSKLQLKETAYDFDTARLEEENTKLKELLKEVQSKIRYSSPRGIETFADLDDTLLAKINQVLGEE